MIMTKALLAWAPLALPRAVAFQPCGADPIRRHPMSIRCRHAAPSSLWHAALPLLDDESYPNVLPAFPKGVIFDMDGTLIQHAINFAEMRRRIYDVADACPIGKTLERECVLALTPKLSPEAQEKCMAIFDDIERRAIDEMKIMPGGAELVHFLGESGLKRAVLTRNLEKNTPPMVNLYRDEMEKNSGLRSWSDAVFDPIVARDTRSHSDAQEPLKAKPNPDGILHICEIWGCDPSEVIMVGDSANDDMTAANRAGCGGAVLLTPGGEQLDTDSGYAVGDTEEEIMERTPSLRVESLLELKMCLEALLCERDSTNGDGGQAIEGGVSSDSLQYTSEAGYTVVIPSIGVKNV